MAARVVLLLSLVSVISAQTTHEPESGSRGNIILECLNLLHCNRRTPVCGSNGTHCWNAASDCERAKFNCLHLHKKDFDKVALKYCDDLTVGGIKLCCARKYCSQHTTTEEPVPTAPNSQEKPCDRKSCSHHTSTTTEEALPARNSHEKP